jgi:hypothetical protein
LGEITELPLTSAADLPPGIDKIRLRPDEWTSGDAHWIIDMAGDVRAIGAGLRAVAERPLKGKDVVLLARDAAGKPKVERLANLIATADAARTKAEVPA